MKNLFSKSALGAALALAFSTGAMAAPASLTSAGGTVTATVNDSGTFSSLAYTGTEFVDFGSPMSYYYLTTDAGSAYANNADFTNPFAALTSSTGAGTASYTSSVGGLSFVQTITLYDSYAAVSVTLSNTTSTDITGVQWSAGIDPDQAIPTSSTYATSNTILGQGGDAAVSAADPASPWKRVTLMNTTSASAFAIAAYIDSTCCSPVLPGSVFSGAQSVGFNNYGDYSINLAYDIGSIGAYRSATIGYNYVFAVPEPETYAMLMAGLGLMGAVARRRKQKS